MRDLKADLALCEKATPGPWEVQRYFYEEPGYEEFIKSAAVVAYEEFIESAAVVADVYTDVYTITRNNWSNPVEADLEFIAQARTGWPEAIQRALEAEKERDELRAVLKEMTEREH